MYTVKQVAELAGVSVRTLHHYHEIGLLLPPHVGANGYRYYDASTLLRLQQILLYRETGMALAQIRDILTNPDFDVVDALRAQRQLLEQRNRRNQEIISTINATLKHILEGEPMSKHQIFKGLTPEEERDNTRHARLQYGPDTVNESVKRWSSYSAQEKQAIIDEGNAIYEALVAQMEAGEPAESDRVQETLTRWHQHIRYFYEPTVDILRGLGELYNTDPAFMANFQKLHVNLPAFLQQSITHYADVLETAEIARMLADDASNQNQR